MKISDVLYENKITGKWVKKNKNGFFEVYKNGVTHSTRVAIIGESMGLEKAKYYADKE